MSCSVESGSSLAKLVVLLKQCLFTLKIILGALMVVIESISTGYQNHMQVRYLSGWPCTQSVLCALLNSDFSILISSSFSIYDLAFNF